MANNNTSHSLVRQTVDDLIIAELFLVQATIESATAIGDGLSTLGRQITPADEAETAPADTLSQTLQRIAENALEPYSSRYKYLRDLKNTGDWVAPGQPKEADAGPASAWRGAAACETGATPPKAKGGSPACARHQVARRADHAQRRGRHLVPALRLTSARGR